VSIGILYESKEWSAYALEKNIKALGVPAKLIDMQFADMEDASFRDRLLSFDLIVNRVFASSVFRGHHTALKQTHLAIEFLKEHDVPMINPYNAHYYEISKALQAKTLATHGFPVPKVYQTPEEFQVSDAYLANETVFPCIIKPDCGGRTTYTYIANSPEEFDEAKKNAPNIPFVVQEYIRPEFGFITRIELIGGQCRLIVKRSVIEGGLSAYHLGSSYEPYEDCPDEIKDAATRAMTLLEIEIGSLDIIENRSDFFIIDVNSVSNVSEDNTEMFSFDLMKEYAAYITESYNSIT